MSDVIPIGTKVTSVKTSPQFDTYGKVVVKISDSEAFEAGNNTGRTLEVSNPWGTQAIANHILARLQGRTANATGAFRYTPYDANGAILDPAAEMGDFINAADVFGGIFTRKRTFGRLMKANVGSPTDEEINHEYQFESPQRREYTRMFGEVKASILIQAGEIEAKVSKSSPQGQTSFRWSLTDEAHRWYANNSDDPVMEVNKDGLTVSGTCWVDGLLNDKPQTHKRIFVADAQGQFLLIYGIVTHPVGFKGEQVILLPPTFGSILVVVIDGRLLTGC